MSLQIHKYTNRSLAPNMLCMLLVIITIIITITIHYYVLCTNVLGREPNFIEDFRRAWSTQLRPPEMGVAIIPPVATEP